MVFAKNLFTRLMILYKNTRGMPTGLKGIFGTAGCDCATALRSNSSEMALSHTRLVGEMYDKYQVMLCSVDDDSVIFDIFIGFLRGDILEPYLFIIC